MLRSAGINLHASQLEQLWRYHNLLRLRNQDRELTRIIGFESMVLKHYIDCMIVGDYHDIPSPVLDIGTGAGFPGIPLKIRYPELSVWLGEPRPKRVAFLKEAVKTLKLRDVSIFDHKVINASFKEPVKAVISRAVEDMAETCIRTSACLPIGGQLIFMKGPAVDPEIEMIKRRFGSAFKLIKDEHYLLPNSIQERRLIVLEKMKEQPQLRERASS